MKNKFKSIFAAVALVGSAWLMQSCNLDENDPNQFGATGFWRSETDFTGNITAMMNQFRGYDQNIMFNAGELRTDYYVPEVSIDGSALNTDWIVRNQYSNSQTQFSKYMDFYGYISNCNTYIYYDEQNGETAFGSNTAARNYNLGIIYGMRAWCLFQIHKMWGTGPLRVNADVILGNYDPESLYMTQASVEEFLNQIKSDINSSLQYFNNAGSTTFPLNPGGVPHGYHYWTKGATEMLAGEVYLWSGKVSTGDHKANPADVTTAKTYLQNVVNNYGYALAPTYDDAINGNKAQNNEVIFATYYDNGKETSSNWYNYVMYDYVTGGTPNQYWSPVGQDGTSPATVAQCWSYYTDPATGSKSRNQYYYTKQNGQQRYCISNALWYQYDAEDSRRLTLIPLYEMSQAQREERTALGLDNPNAIQFIENFNADDYYLASCFIWKYHGSAPTGQERFVGSNDMIYYRLPLAILMLAEVANYEGDNSGVVNYINQIRQRAYGDNWDATQFGYTAGDFTQNETAILQEYAKEFLQEGQRWWTLRRLTTVKGGTDQDHMVFQPQGALGYGLDAKLAAHPNWGEVKTYTMAPQPVNTSKPLLDYATQKYIVLWPLNADLLGSDPALLQTPGYTYPSDPDREQPWIEN
ncbi:MAG: RagB/SusD family nutrient uptake outer membrane protein [Paramuribaculum sp.]|nr:RagB/SusD family nutrient uptake outer membrane protein [Paramuribaculum sp.]